MRRLLVSLLTTLRLRGFARRLWRGARDFQQEANLRIRTARFKPDARLIYKSTPQGDLDLHVFRPPTPAPVEGCPAIVFFHGGGWEQGSARHFYAQCSHFAARGMVAISVEYRRFRKHGTGPHEATADSFSAIRWVRRNAEQLNINPDVIVAGGGSVGGHMTAAVNFIEGLADPEEDASVSTSTSAMIFFNAVLDTTPAGWGAELLDGETHPFSPIHNLRPGLPPSIVLHGTDDVVTPYENAVRFTEEMKKLGNSCELFTYPGVGHGFYRYALNRQLFRETIDRCDEFLVSLGILEPR